MKKALNIAKINIFEIFRDFKSHGIVFILPMIFMLIFGFLFSKVTENSSFNVGVLKNIESENQSGSVMDVDSNETKNDTEFNYNEIIKALQSVEDDEGIKVFEAIEYDNVELIKTAVRENKIDVGIVNSDDYLIKFYINEASQKSIIARSVILDVINPVSQIVSESEGVVAEKNISGFQLQAGGLIIYGILIMIPQIAGGLATLKDKNYIFRYKSSLVKPFDIIAGFTISSFLVGIVQCLLLFYVATWFGLQVNVQALYALVLAIPVILFSIGTGLLIGTLAPKASTAQDLGTILSIVLGFLSGSFIVGIEIVGFDFGGKFFSITNIIPTFYAYKAITELLIYGGKLGDVVKEIIVISASSLILFILGVIFWNKANRK